MLNEELKLNPNLFDADVEKRAIRDGFGEGLVLAGDANKNVVALCADLTESTRTNKFAEKYPERFFEVGVAEQNMAAIAAGLGVSGKIPFISSFAVFSPGRNWEQIRTTIAYNDSNVKIAGHHAGFCNGPDGATHQALEDIATMRVMPNMKVIVPCDAIEAKKATLAAANIWGPVYLRFEREKTPVVTSEATPFTPGKIGVLWHPKKYQAVIIACGIPVHASLLAAKELKDEGIEVTVVNCHTIKPLDGSGILEVVEKCGAVVTAEEHQVAGGLGGAVAELLALKLPTPIEFVGVHDSFGESGVQKELVEKYGLGIKDIKAAVKKVLKRK
jgi:transketolase